MPRRKTGGEPDKPGRHIGYRRQDSRHPWVRVVEGDSWRECWLTLVEQVRDRGDDPDLLVIEEGRDPSSVHGGLVIFTRTDV